MDYELAKQLKDAGFPQYGDFMWVESYGRIERWPTTNIGQYPSYSLLCTAPTLSELIEACGKDFKKLWRHSNGILSAHSGTLSGKDAFQKDGETPEEAVARLWLAIKAGE